MVLGSSSSMDIVGTGVVMVVVAVVGLCIGRVLCMCGVGSRPC